VIEDGGRALAGSRRTQERLIKPVSPAGRGCIPADGACCDKDSAAHLIVSAFGDHRHRSDGSSEGASELAACLAVSAGRFRLSRLGGGEPRQIFSWQDS